MHSTSFLHFFNHCSLGSHLQWPQQSLFPFSPIFTMVMDPFFLFLRLLASSATKPTTTEDGPLPLLHCISTFVTLCFYFLRVCACFLDPLSCKLVLFFFPKLITDEAQGVFGVSGSFRPSKRRFYYFRKKLNNS